jgi:acyl-CoA thioesterase-1
VFVGTSLTAGLGLDPDSAYPALVARKADSAGIPVTVVNAGVSGETSAGALRRIEWVLREPADVLVIETGANDGLRALRVDSTRANLSAILERARAVRPDARLVLIQMEAPPNLGAEYTGQFRAMFPAVAREHGATLAPFLLGGVAGEARLNQGDGIHPNEAGARVVAETVWRALRPVLDSARRGAPARTAGVAARPAG